MMKSRFAAFIAASIAALAFAVPADAGNTNFLTERNAAITFPFSPPNRANSTAGSIDNMTIGATTPRAGNFTTLTSTSAPSGAGITALFASPPAIGGTAPAAGTFTDLIANDIVGGNATLTVTGQAGATATSAGGLASLTGGAGGATSGTGGVATVTGGAGSGGNANGGDVNLTGGAANGSGVNGVVRENGVILRTQGTPAAATTSATLTAANVLAGIITVNQGAAGASAQQLPTAAAMDTALPTSAASDAFDFSVINISTVAAEAASLTTNSGWTLVGDMDIIANSASTTKSAARFRARKTGTGAWVLYRLS